MLILPDLRSFEASSPQREVAVSPVQREFAPGGIELGTLWRLLIAGEIRVTETFSIANRAFAALAPRSTERALALPSPFDRLVFERILEGECPKVLAAEVRLSMSTLSTRCTNVLAAIGCERSISRASVLVSMAALAAKGIPLGRAHVEGFSADGVTRWLVSVMNPADSLRDRLSPSEFDVAGYSVDGKRLAEIATARGVSQRTVANQLASIFRKLGVSGRGALRALAIHAQARRLTCRDASRDEQSRQVTSNEYCTT
jgi:DNA-binding CsgD family transcriptional regulator